ncbi:LuxR C-terminal-related transcriptional regulator [Aporhodopirellula aestuarii]|uniref:Response regulator transcription factor n=1 Tax=Aporhodopirellula aestuarii TaxID=2950107 RepID=A0ABT0TY07_9BACT|nr:response regulator transcription factor [Aporhodopirellula aestuarii]MCM2369477.1 response regulator transcription factor [Aporhodopirellula aestuarii]
MHFTAEVMNPSDADAVASTETSDGQMLAWSMYDESLYAERALRAEAMGYINKQHVTDTIIDAIRTVLSGELFISKELSVKMLQRVVTGKESVAVSPVESLSDRELETFRMIGQGVPTKEIAKEMCLSPKTIETYRARIKEKLEIDDITSLASDASEFGFNDFVSMFKVEWYNAQQCA